ncbi:LysR family transcriptional regulator [Sciscionella sediminilitoris]|uniref:LysR family transcriptional regulator n=1 Tax=Sciscionella sediminilitoris TaxID=1445613 RepID=UPI0007C8266A|nr:LysR family transcriptional regulator [Sciscionella sp. SE31]
MFEIRRLQMLAELQRLGTMAAVATELHLTAPAVSMQIAALEREVGLRLTERQGRRVVLTPAGQVLAQHGRDIADLVSVAEMEVETLREGTSGTYRIAAFPSAARSYVAQTWRQLREDAGAGPELRLRELEPQAATAALASGETDIAITHAYSNAPADSAPGLMVTALTTEEVLLATTADSGPAGPARLDEHAKSDWVVPQSDLACAEMVRRACGSAGFEPVVVAEATDFAVQLGLVAAGLCVALVPRLAADSVPRGVRLRALEQPVRRHHFAVTRRSSRGDPGIGRVLELLERNADGLAREHPDARR